MLKVVYKLDVNKAYWNDQLVFIRAIARFVFETKLTNKNIFTWVQVPFSKHWGAPVFKIETTKQLKYNDWDNNNYDDDYVMITMIMVTLFLIETWQDQDEVSSSPHDRVLCPRWCLK